VHFGVAYLLQVGQQAGHPELCERCAPVIADSGFQLPQPAAVTA